MSWFMNYAEKYKERRDFEQFAPKITVHRSDGADVRGWIRWLDASGAGVRWAADGHETMLTLATLLPGLADGTYVIEKGGCLKCGNTGKCTLSQSIAGLDSVLEMPCSACPLGRAGDAGVNWDRGRL
jgi:hypothetical protein